MAISDLKTKIDRLPEQPGVYIYLNERGETLYVGKARVLRDRVRSYLSSFRASPKTTALVTETHDLEVVVTDSVVEALVLESHLIKQRNPKYNVLLRDDKNYPYLQLTNSETFPRLLVSRRVKRDGDFYAGPFLPTSFARKTMVLAHRLFGIRSCNEIITGRRDRPCLEYDIKRCIAPCVESICTSKRYQAAVEHAKLFLDGRNDELVGNLRTQMLEESDAERFEKAAQLRDAIRTIETLHNRQQKISNVQLGDRDAVGIKVGSSGAVIQVFQMRSGKVIERVELVSDVDTSKYDATESEIVQAALRQFYEVRDVPPEVHVPFKFQDDVLFEQWLSDRASRRVRLLVPKRGEKRGLLQLASRNAAMAYAERFEKSVVANKRALEELRATLGLSRSPQRIECFDVSTIQGSETVGSVVVCERGRLRSDEYRKFKIKGQQSKRKNFIESSVSESVQVQDDFSAIREIVFRRFRRLLKEGGPFPDLVVVDGGKGQLSAAYDALDDLGLANLTVIGIAKKEELIFVRNQAAAISLPRNSQALLLIQRVRDEAHRVALTFHRRSRRIRDFRSELDLIPGVGPRRRKKLLTNFGSLAGVRRASREELIQVVGECTADAILGYFSSSLMNSAC